ncbi:MAG: N-acetyl sugar amidotransferase [Actinomycetota bacterium]
MVKLSWCTTCLNMSTRPRIRFDSYGRCNACIWNERKKSLDWSVREHELQSLIDRHRKGDGGFDCLVPVSGGKDGSYVAHTLKTRYGLRPLALTVTPALALEIGNKNLQRFIESGFDHIQINPHPRVMMLLNRHGFIEMGFPYYGWLSAIQAGVVRMAVQLGISLVFYGEEGETEYGGTSQLEDKPVYNVQYMNQIYLEGGLETVLSAAGVTERSAYFFTFPSEEVLRSSQLELTHWSYFENWDPYRNYLVAKEHCGLQEASTGNPGTFTNFAQNDQALYSLHTYLMYLKFGFGRATQDAGIEIRRGAMTREQGVHLVRLYDGQFPEEYLSTYLDYYGMSHAEFDAVLDRWANRDLFVKQDGRWRPKFTVS